MKKSKIVLNIACGSLLAGCAIAPAIVMTSCSQAPLSVITEDGQTTYRQQVNEQTTIKLDVDGSFVEGIEGGIVPKWSFKYFDENNNEVVDLNNYLNTFSTGTIIVKSSLFYLSADKYNSELYENVYVDATASVTIGDETRTATTRITIAPNEETTLEITNNEGKNELNQTSEEQTITLQFNGLYGGNNVTDSNLVAKYYKNGVLVSSETSTPCQFNSDTLHNGKTPTLKIKSSNDFEIEAGDQWKVVISGLVVTKLNEESASVTLYRDITILINPIK